MNIITHVCKNRSDVQKCVSKIQMEYKVKIQHVRSSDNQIVTHG